MPQKEWKIPGLLNMSWQVDLSTKLLNRITFYELNALRRIIPEVSIVNGLSMDEKYDGEPERSDEIMQSWEALST